MQVRIERIVPRGFGIAFSDGLTVFVALAAEGDLVDVRLTEIKGRTAFAEVESVIEPSPDRVTPPCPYFGSCGGCDFQQMNYAAQLGAKVAMVRDCLHRIAKIEWTGEIPIIPSPLEFGYRLRAQWHVETTSKKIGYYRRDSRDLVDIQKCIVLAPELNDELDALRRELPWETFYSDKMQVDAALGSNGGVSIHSTELAEPAGEIAVKAAGESYVFSAKSFFQGNRAMVDSWSKRRSAMQPDHVLSIFIAASGCLPCRWHADSNMSSVWRRATMRLNLQRSTLQMRSSTMWNFERKVFGDFSRTWLKATSTSRYSTRRAPEPKKTRL
jgi:23S rRNA (uracil1939-C5)-methyltransferase